MTKGEHSQIKLKFQATIGVEKFNIPKSTPVEYLVTLNDFEKVSFESHHQRSEDDFVHCRASTNIP